MPKRVKQLETDDRRPVGPDINGGEKLAQLAVVAEKLGLTLEIRPGAAFGTVAPHFANRCCTRDVK